MTRRWAALLLAVSIPATSGCVAAAIPLAAGAVLVRDQAVPERQTDAASAATTLSGTRVTQLALTELPPPDTARSAGNLAIAAFHDYAKAQLAAQPGIAKRHSALLVSASELRTERASCGSAPPGVFIDLDPGRGTFDPLAPGQADGALAAALNDLRAEGVTIVWFSRLSSSFEDATREALATSGYDPQGVDRLVLLRDIGERKQSRRDEAAKTVCPIAMLGDERADFDELYLYLKQPEAALALDAVIGRGWFLVSPFAPDQTTKESTR